MFCTQCGKEIKQEWTVCPYCGNAKLEAALSLATDAPTAAAAPVMPEAAAPQSAVEPSPPPPPDWKAALQEYQLEGYIELFEKNNLTDVEILSELTEADLEKLGIAIMGDRKRILKIYAAQTAQEKDRGENIQTPALPDSNILQTSHSAETPQEALKKGDAYNPKTDIWICSKCNTQNSMNIFAMYNICKQCGKAYEAIVVDNPPS